MRIPKRTLQNYDDQLKVINFIEFHLIIDNC